MMGGMGLITRAIGSNALRGRSYQPTIMPKLKPSASAKKRAVKSSRIELPMPVSIFRQSFTKTAKTFSGGGYNTILGLGNFVVKISQAERNKNTINATSQADFDLFFKMNTISIATTTVKKAHLFSIFMRAGLCIEIAKAKKTKCGNSL
jgi:hypothetical protein